MTSVTGEASTAGSDRVVERRRAVALARHYRESEGLSIREIADRLGRSPATIKAYFYDPSDANKRPTRSPSANASPGTTRAVNGAVRRTTPSRASAGQNARRHGVPRQPYARSRPALERTPTGATCARAGSLQAGAASVGTPSLSAPPVGWSLKSPPTLGIRPYEARASRARQAVSARTQSLGGFLVELNAPRLCESRKSADSWRRELTVGWQQPPVVRSAQSVDRLRSRPGGRRGYRNRGKGIAGPEQPREPKQSWSAQTAHAWM